VTSNVPIDHAEGLHLTFIPANNASTSQTKYTTLPTWLRGSLIRNGPGNFSGAWAIFDGLAMLVKIKINGKTGSIVCSHRFIESSYYRSVKDRGGEIKLKLAHNPDTTTKEPLHSLKYISSVAYGVYKYGMQMGDNALVSVFPFGDELIAHTETVSGTYSIKPETLETIERVVYQDDIHGLVTTAHPAIHQPTGDLINIASDFTPVWNVEDGVLKLKQPEITLYRTSPDSPRKREKIATVPYAVPTSPTWIHQVAVTEHYAVVVQNPVFFDIKAMVLGNAGEFMAFKWLPELGTTIHVVPLDYNNEVDSSGTIASDKIGVKRKKEVIRVYKAPAFLATHWVNAFETESEVDGSVRLHLDGAITADPSLMSHWALANVRSDPPSIDYGGGDDSSTSNATISRAADLPNSYFRRLTLNLKHWPCGTNIADQIEKEGREKDKEGNDGTPTATSNIPEAIFTTLAASDDAYGHAFELPSIHPSFIGRKYRYAYGCCVSPRPSNAYNAVCKLDLHTGNVKTWSFNSNDHSDGTADSSSNGSTSMTASTSTSITNQGEGGSGSGGGITGEPVFIPNPHGVSEDDGVAVGIFTQPDGKTAVVVLDGESWEEVGRAVLPYSLPSGFHACWLFD